MFVAKQLADVVKKWWLRFNHRWERILDSKLWNGTWNDAGSYVRLSNFVNACVGIWM